MSKNQTNRYNLYLDKNDSRITFAAKELQKVAKKYDIEIATKDIKQMSESNEDNHSSIFIFFDERAGIQKEGYSLCSQKHGSGFEVTLKYADGSGAMYGLLDLCDHIKEHERIELVDNKIVSPFMEKRGIKFNIPLDARTPSYSDGSDIARKNIANMWEISFWTEFIDRMALDRFNSLTLWNLSPFPSMIKTPGYEEIALDDVKKPAAQYQHTLRGARMYDETVAKFLVTVKKMSIEAKIKFWQDVMSYANSRGVEIYIFTWNIFTYGTEGNKYGIDDSQENPITKDYFRKSVEAMIKTYPLLAGIGITAGEQMDKNLKGKNSVENWLMQTYGQGVLDALKENPNRAFKLVHRVHETGLDIVEETFSDLDDRLDYSFKYSQAHMYSSLKPIFGDGFFKKMPEHRKTWLTVRNDDFYLYRWCDPSFARQYILNMPKDVLRGIHMGPDGYTLGREYNNVDEKLNGKLVYEKFWMRYAIWGRMSYNPCIKGSCFISLLRHEYPHSDCNNLYRAWVHASNIIPEVTRLHFKPLDFEWNPETCCSNVNKFGHWLYFNDVHDFAQCSCDPGTDYISIKDYCDGNFTEGKTPIEVIDTLASDILLTYDFLKKIKDNESDELKEITSDIKAMAALGQYYISKIEMAIHYVMFKKGNGIEHKNKAVVCAKKASEQWRNYADKARKLYKPQFLTRLQYTVDIEALQEFADNDLYIVKNDDIESGRDWTY